jgi:hypothetical protein
MFTRRRLLATSAALGALTLLPSGGVAQAGGLTFVLPYPLSTDLVVLIEPISIAGTATATPSPTATPVRQSVWSGTATFTVGSVPTPTATATPGQGGIWSGTATFVVGDPPTPTATRTATLTPTATRTPSPTATKKPTNTPAPTRTPRN